MIPHNARPTIVSTYFHSNTIVEEGRAGGEAGSPRHIEIEMFSCVASGARGGGRNQGHEFGKPKVTTEKEKEVARSEPDRKERTKQKKRTDERTNRQRFANDPATTPGRKLTCINGHSGAGSRYMTRA